MINRAAVGESELVAAEGRNAAGISRRGVVEVVARVEGGVAHKLEDRSVKAAGARAGVMLVNPAAPRPISAGIQPELESMPSTASTLKLENVAPPISGSLMSAPSMAKVASTPRWPLMANCA